MRCFVFLGLFCILCATGCKKDTKISEPPPSSDGCDPLPASPPLGWQIQTRDHNLNKYNGFYDPNNLNYFYFLVDRAPGLGSVSGVLTRVNLVTGQKVLLDSSIISYPQININGWITYFKSDWNIYKVKTNGDSLTKLTNDGNSQYPSWSFDGQYIYFSASSGLPAYKMTKNGTLVDTLQNVSGISGSKISNKIVYGGLINNVFHIVVKNLDDSSEKVLCSDPDGFMYLVMDNTDTYVYWSNPKGVYRINVSNGSKETLIQNCPRSQYLTLNLTLNSNHLVATRYDQEPINSSTLYTQKDCYKINSDGSNPQLISIP